MVKVDIGSISLKLASIIAKVCEHENIPSDWQDEKIKKHPKKGNLVLFSNWPGITTLITINLGLSFVHDERVSTIRDSGPVGHEQTTSIRIIVEQSAEFKSPLYLVFVHDRKIEVMDWDDLLLRMR